MFSIDNILIFTMVFLGFLALIYFFIFCLLDFFALFFFEKHEAIILECTLIEAPTFIEDMETKYTIKIQYKYDFNGVIYESSRLNSFNQIIKSKIELQRLLENITHSNRNVKISICPYFPSYSVIFPMRFINGKLLLEFFIALLGFLSGIYFLYVRLNMGLI